MNLIPFSEPTTCSGAIALAPSEFYSAFHYPYCKGTPFRPLSPTEYLRTMTLDISLQYSICPPTLLTTPQSLSAPISVSTSASQLSPNLGLRLEDILQDTLHLSLLFYLSPLFGWHCYHIYPLFYFPAGLALAVFECLWVSLIVFGWLWLGFKIWKKIIKNHKNIC